MARLCRAVTAPLHVITGLDPVVYTGTLPRKIAGQAR